MTRRRFVFPFQLRGVDSHMFLEFGPRYGRPQDDTTVMSIFHRTTGGNVSVLLERDQIRPLADWMAHGVDDLTIPSGQTTAVLSSLHHGIGNTGAQIRITWNGSGSGRTIELSAEDRRAVAAWLDKVDRTGWEGWKSGVHIEGAPDAQVD